MEKVKAMTGEQALRNAWQLAADLPLSDRTDAVLALLGNIAADIINTSPSDQAERLEALAKIARA